MPDSPTSEPESTFVCDCDDWVRSACAGEPFYRELEDKRYCVLHFPSKEKSADFQQALQRKLANEDFDFRGVWFPDKIGFNIFFFKAEARFNYAVFNDKAYFRSVHFSSDIFLAWADFSHATFRAEADFSHADFRVFTDFSHADFRKHTDFSHATFSRKAHFSDTVFRAEAVFQSATFVAEVDFCSTTFNENANFTYSKFGGTTEFRRSTFDKRADFDSANFSQDVNFTDVTFGAEANFYSTTFDANADFYSATLSGDVNFINAAFSKKAGFSRATFRAYVKFAASKIRPVFGDQASLDFQFARIEELDRISFHTLILLPHWFVNADARKFSFTNVEWNYDLNRDIEDLAARRVGPSHRLLAVAYRQLALNAEENHRYEEASKFRYMAMETRRLESWRGFAPWRLSWWYWLASGYGERVWQAFFVLLGILLLSALLYNQVGFARWEPKVASESDLVAAKRDEVGTPMKFSRALMYSLAVMTLQKPEPRPATTAAQTVVILETILGPVQAALLALAIRRKFMR